LGMALFFLAALILLGSWSGSYGSRGSAGVWGGPADATEPDDLFANEAAGFLRNVPELEGEGLASLPSSPIEADSIPAALFSGVSLGAGSPRSVATIYKVDKGETLTSISAKLGVSIETLITANPEVRSRALRVGQELTVLPVSGVLHRVGEGETAESISRRFKLTSAQLRDFNRAVDLAALTPGMSLLIPGAAAAYRDAPTSVPSLPDLGTYFIKPAEGFNWGKLHSRNAVDIANSCGTEIEAAAEGLIVPDGSCSGEAGWNSGYGTCLAIEHPNGTKSRYAHLDGKTVGIGDYVAQGEVIGTMGRTGEATGCHVHFEVSGAQNPFAKY